jgi:hypothetical protein
MAWADIAGTVGKYAPLLGTLLAGQAGGAVGGLIASALGTAATPDGVEQALMASPDAVVALRKIEADKTVRLQELVEQHAAAELAAATAQAQREAEDRASARRREVDAHDTITPRLLAIFVTIGFFGVIAFLLVVGKPAAGGDALLVMLGSLGTAWTCMVTYYYGTTSSSAGQVSMLARSTPPPS